MARPKKRDKEDETIQDQEMLASLLENAAENTNKSKKLKFKTAVKNTAFDIFSEETSSQLTKDLMAKAGLGDGFTTSTNSSRDFLPVPWLAMQYLIGRPGIPVNTITEFIGAESVGKSSLVYALMGHFVAHNIPCFYINSEPKSLEPDWQLRLLGTNTAKAAKIRDIINVQELSSLEEMDEHLRAWVAIKRDTENIPIDIPLIVVVDSITKLMNPEEFAASGFAKIKPGEKKKDEGSANVSKQPGITAKWLHQWSRLITPFLTKKNVTIIAVSGQNQNMDSGGASFIKLSEKKNKTRTGGNALNQSAALQFTVTLKKSYKNSAGEDCGKEVLLFCIKNSYGPSAREIQYVLYDDRKENYKKDIPGVYTQQAIDMATPLAQLLVDFNILGFTVKRKKYSSTKLDLYDLTASEVEDYVMNNPDVFMEVATNLSIKGYESEEQQNE